MSGDIDDRLIDYAEGYKDEFGVWLAEVNEILQNTEMSMTIDKSCFHELNPLFIEGWEPGDVARLYLISAKCRIKTSEALERKIWRK